jgi:hypothetical protein
MKEIIRTIAGFELEFRMSKILNEISKEFKKLNRILFSIYMERQS